MYTWLDSSSTTSTLVKIEANADGMWTELKTDHSHVATKVSAPIFSGNMGRDSAITPKLNFNFAFFIALLFLLLPPSLVKAEAQSFGSSIDFTMFRLATEHNDPSAQYLVGRNYLMGKTVNKDLKEAVQWFERAAKQGHIKAQYQLGKMYLEGNDIPKNYDGAFEYLSMAAKNRHAGAQYELGNYYLLGVSGAIDYTKAIFWFRKAAEKNHRRAYFQLGKLLYEGNGKEESEGEAIHYLTLAADSGLADAARFLQQINHADAIHDPAVLAEVADDFDNDTNDIDSDDTIDPNAQYRLAISYLNGDGVGKDPATAAKLLQKLADSNHYKAQYQLALLFRDGNGVAQNSDLSLKWLKQAAQNGSLKAQREINKEHKATSALSSDKSDSFTNTSTKIADSQRVRTPVSSHSPTDTHYILGLKFLQGEGVEQDYSLAAKWFMKAANNNHSMSKYQLGLMYKDGLGVSANQKSAEHWLQEAADDGIAQAKLALQQLSQPANITVNHIQIVAPENDKKIEKIFASNRSPTTPLMTDASEGNRESQYQLGLKYLSGNGLEKDIDKGIEWISKAADNNYLPAQLELGSIYKEGGDVRRDYAIAAQWYKKAAQSGDSSAQYTLAEMYKEGLGLDRDNAKAVKWYRMAANQGHKLARQQLGGCRIC